jgi:hypothetical protein
MRCIIFIVLLLCPIDKLVASDNHYIQINNSKIFLRYSSRAEVEEILGATSNIKFFEHGGEDFLWNNFTIYYYNDGKLYFHYNENGDIIRITVSSQCDYAIALHNRPIGDISFDIVFGETKDERNPYISNKIIMYTKMENLSLVQYAYWFNEDGSIKWFDFYYEKTW